MFYAVGLFYPDIKSSNFKSLQIFLFYEFLKFTFRNLLTFGVHKFSKFTNSTNLQIFWVYELSKFTIYEINKFF